MLKLSKSEKEILRLAKEHDRSQQRYALIGLPAGAAAGYAVGRHFGRPGTGTAVGALGGALAAGAAHRARHGPHPIGKYGKDPLKEKQSSVVLSGFSDELQSILSR